MKTTKNIYGITLALTCSLAVTLKAQNLYVANAYNNTIGEYNLNGSPVNASLITSGVSEPYGIAISGNDLFVAAETIYGNAHVAEYTTSGATVNASLISLGQGTLTGIAISGNDLFVANNTAGTIGEYTTSGATVNASLISGLDDPWGIAISGNDLFVANYGSGTVGEYTLSGDTVNVSLIAGLESPEGIVVAPEPATVPLAVLGAAALWLWRRRK